MWEKASAAKKPTRLHHSPVSLIIIIAERHCLGLLLRLIILLLLQGCLKLLAMCKYVAEVADVLDGSTYLQVQVITHIGKLTKSPVSTAEPFSLLILNAPVAVVSTI